jgi:hypothetical protein
MISWQYDKFVMSFTNAYMPNVEFDATSGNYFYGTLGALHVSRTGYTLKPTPPRARPGESPPAPAHESANVTFRQVGQPADRAHVRNFLDCVKSRQKPLTDRDGLLFDAAAAACGACHSPWKMCGWNGKKRLPVPHGGLKHADDRERQEFTKAAVALRLPAGGAPAAACTLVERFAFQRKLAGPIWRVCRQTGYPDGREPGCSDEGRTDAIRMLSDSSSRRRGPTPVTRGDGRRFSGLKTCPRRLVHGLYRLPAHDLVLPAGSQLEGGAAQEMKDRLGGRRGSPAPQGPAGAGIPRATAYTQSREVRVHRRMSECLSLLRSAGRMSDCCWTPGTGITPAQPSQTSWRRAVADRHHPRPMPRVAS